MTLAATVPNGIQGLMRRRLRKKKRVGEFKEFGFEVVAILRSDMSGDELNAFVDRWIAAVERGRLAFGGGCGAGDKLDGFVTRMARGSATQDDRDALIAFLDSDAAVVRHEVGQLRDAWT